MFNSLKSMKFGQFLIIAFVIVAMIAADGDIWKSMAVSAWAVMIHQAFYTNDTIFERQGKIFRFIDTLNQRDLDICKSIIDQGKHAEYLLNKITALEVEIQELKQRVNQ